MFSFLKNYEGAHAGLPTKDAYRCACAYPTPERGNMGFSKGKDKLIPITVKLRYIESAAAKELQINDYIELLETENEKLKDNILLLNKEIQNLNAKIDILTGGPSPD